MSNNLKGLRLIITIVDRKKGKDVIKLYEKLGCTSHNTFLGNGTAPKEIFDFLVKSKTTKDIAKILNISEKTVRNHISNAIQKLGVKGRSQAVVELIKMGEIKI